MGYELKFVIHILQTFIDTSCSWISKVYNKNLCDLHLGWDRLEFMLGKLLFSVRSRLSLLMLLGKVPSSPSTYFLL